MAHALLTAHTGAKAMIISTLSSKKLAYLRLSASSESMALHVVLQYCEAMHVHFKQSGTSGETRMGIQAAR